MDCIANMVAEAVDYAGKALSTVNETMHEHESEMVLKTLTPTTQQVPTMFRDSHYGGLSSLTFYHEGLLGSLLGIAVPP